MASDALLLARESLTSALVLAQDELATRIESDDEASTESTKLGRLLASGILSAAGAALERAEELT